MATVVNTRDVLLLGASTRILWTGVRGIKIAADAATFSVTNAGVPTPATINFTSTLNGISGTINWSVVLGTATLTSSTGATTSLVYASMTSKVITVRATIVDGGVTYTDEFTVSKVVDGNTGTSGTNALLMSMSATSQVFRISKANVASPSSITFTAWRNNVTGANFSVTSGTATLTGISGDTATLTYANMSSDVVTVRVADNTNSYADTVTIVKVREGIDAISGYLSNESVSLPADESGVVLSYSGCGGNFIVYYGAVDVTSSCTFSVLSNPSSLTPTNNIVTSGASAGTYAITGGMNVPQSASVTYRATYTNAFGTVFTLDKVFSITKSRTGSTGATGAQGTTGSAARIAYVKTTGTLSPSPSLSTVSGDTFPATGTWGESNAWQNYPPSIVAGEQVWQTTGTYNYLTNQTTWVAPYLSNLKVGTLSALTVNTGTLTVDASGYIRGGQTGYNTGTGFWLGYDSATYKMSVGSSTQGITWDGSALTVKGNLQVDDAAISGTTMTGSGAKFNSDGTFCVGSAAVRNVTGNGYASYGGNITYDGTNMYLNGIIRAENGSDGIVFKAAGFVSSNVGNLVKICSIDNLIRVDRPAGTTLPAVYLNDTTSTSTEMLYVTNSSAFTGTSMSTFVSSAGDSITASAPSAKNAVKLSSGRLGFGSSVPIDLNGSMGSSGQTLISQGSGSTPAWGKTIDGGAATSDGSGNATIAVVMPNANFGFSACPTAGKIVTVTSVTNTGGNNYNVVVQTQTSSTGAAAAGVPFRWTAIG